MVNRRQPRLRRRAFVLSVASLLVSCGTPADDQVKDRGERGQRSTAMSDDPGFGHVHGLGLNPADGMVYAATHFGVWRLPATAGTSSRDSGLARVADRWQDTMGFTVAGPDIFYASGHPDLREDAPAHLGLIVSKDRAETWEPVALRGEADFHDLSVTGDRVYGYDATSGRLLVSKDSGRTWEARPRRMIADLTVDPGDPERLVIAGSDGLLVSQDGGTSFRPIPGGPPLVAVDWAGDVLAGADDQGKIWIAASGRPESAWERRGGLAGAPQAFVVAPDGRLLAADAHGVKISSDAGKTWRLLADYGGQGHR